jgi:shikimate 5-dehydrogenase
MRKSVLVGLIGTGIQASRSPALHEAEGVAQGLSYRNCPGSLPGLREAQFGDQRLGVSDQCLKQVPALFSGG